MEKTKPFELIATQFNVSNETAKHFLGRVQKSFKKDKPPQQLIIDFMAGKKYSTLPRPHQIATLMSEAGIWVYPLNAEPPRLADEPDHYFKRNNA